MESVESPILLISENDDLIQVVVQTLNEGGYNNIEALPKTSAAHSLLNSGNASLILIENTQFDFEDLNSFFQSSEHIDKWPPSVLIADQDNGWSKLHSRLNFDAFITKPIQKDVLLTTVQKHAGRNTPGKVEHLEKQNAALMKKLMLQDKMASIGNMVAQVSHEINGPIGAVNCSADVLKRCLEKIDTELQGIYHEKDSVPKGIQKALSISKDTLQVIVEGGGRVKSIAQHLKDFSRTKEEPFQETNIHESLDKTVMIVQHQLKERVHIHKEYGNIPPVLGSIDKLNQVFMNLMVNGAQAIEEKGQITLKTFVDNDVVVVEISDTGKGIHPNNLSKIFNSGYTTKEFGEGTGLGLAICYRIIEGHNGTIHVDSELNHGTTFRITLPIFQPAS